MSVNKGGSDMQGFALMLKAMGIDPEKMIEQVTPMIDAIYKEKIEPVLIQISAQRAAEHTAIMSKLESLDAAIKKIDPNYVPSDIQTLALSHFVEASDPGMITNPETPEGGAVDMTTLDPDKLAAMDNEVVQENATVQQNEAVQDEPQA